MIGHGGDGRAELGGQLAVLGVAAGKVSGVIEDVGSQRIDSILGNIVPGKDYSAHGHGGHILILTVIGTGGNDVLGIIGRLGQQLVNVLYSAMGSSCVRS